MLGFVGYQLWGTGLSPAAAQADLKAQFAASLQTTTTEVAVVTTEVAVTSVTTTSAPNPDSSTTTSAPKPTGPTTTEVERQVIPEFSSGDVVAQLVIPSIDVDFFVVSGVGVEELRLGPGHFTDTPLPGQLGNSAIAGHRTTYGQPFHDLDQLAAGDDIVITTAFGTYTYEVRDLKVVEPTDYGVVSTTDPNIATLTLTACHPKWSASQRLIVSAELNELESDRVLPTETDTDENVDASTTTTTEAAETDGEETEAPTTTVLNLGTNDSISTVGLGEVTFGMTIAQAQVAAGTDLINCVPKSDCYRGTPARGPEGISFLVTAGTIERVDIVSGPLTTRSGIGIGSSEDEIMNLFGDQIETQVNDDSSVDLIFVPRDESDAEFRVIFTIRDGVVETFRSGRVPQVTVQNPCAG